MHLLYSLALGALVLVYLPVFWWRKVWRAGHPLAVRERLGFIPVMPGGARLWVHAVSVGEVMAAVPLVRALRAEWPGTEIVLSTVTATGARVARVQLPEIATAFAFPVDWVHATRRSVARVRPTAFIALETELWPNLLRSLARAGVPAILVNGRISNRSFRRYARVKWLFRHVLANVTLFAMQSEEDARRILALGAPPDRVRVTGNLKMDAVPSLRAVDPVWTRIRGGATTPLWIAGSTHRGEEDAVLEAQVKLREEIGARLVVAPRHPERADEVEALVRAKRLSVARRSRLDGAEAIDVVLLDTVGELAALYGLADVIFVGGSLVPVGGHNVIEAALHARPVIFGPHMTNFRDSAALLLGAGGAIQVEDGAALLRALRELFGDSRARQARGAAGAEAVRAHRGACRRTIDALASVLEPPRRRAASG